MPSYGLDSFISDVREATARLSEPADCVDAVAPLLRCFVTNADEILRPEHHRSNPDHYARNAIYISDHEALSLYSLVWLPGQWTPVHDHGTWGVVAVVEGLLEERNFIRVDRNFDQDSGIDLRRGGSILLANGTVTSFVPNPDHIHKTGVSELGDKTLSLHLYGRTMNSFHTYDVAAGTRTCIQVFHNES